MACFYANNGLIASRNPDLLQRSLNVLIGIFNRVGLWTNMKKTVTVTFLQGNIKTNLTEEGYCACMDMRFRKSQERRRVECEQYSADLVVGSLQCHLET